MSAYRASPDRWSRGQWLGSAALVCGLQVALLFWLGDANPKPHRGSGAAPGLRLVGAGAGDLLALMDPTLFAIPHRRGFSGPGWLVVQPQKFEPFVWSNPPGWLELPLADLGEAFQRFIETNAFDAVHILPQSEPELTWPEQAETVRLPQASRFRLSGDLARRRLLTAPSLRSWPSPELLTNSVVQLVIDAAGLPVSFTLLAGSGSKEADQFALARARASRFEPLSRPGKPPAPGDLSWGELIFEWHTTPVMTNASAPGP